MKQTIRLSAIISLLIMTMTVLAGCQTPGKTSNTSVDTTTTATPPAGFDAPLDIDPTYDGQIVRVNLVKFTLPSPVSSITAVLLNGSTVAINGTNSYVYMDLAKGQNVIEVDSTIGPGIKKDFIRMTFQPPLAVYLGAPVYGIDVLQKNTPINGHVSDPSAAVEVNGKNVIVNTDGTFIAQIQETANFNIVEAIARKGLEVDSASLSWYLTGNGQLAPIPIPTSAPSFLPGVTIKAGESTSFEINQSAGSIKLGGLSAFNPLSIAHEQVPNIDYLVNVLPMIPELKISVVPSMYTIYPGIVYHSTVSVETLDTLLSGEYDFFIDAKGNFFDNYANETTVEIPEYNGTNFIIIVK